MSTMARLIDDPGPKWLAEALRALFRNHRVYAVRHGGEDWYAEEEAVDDRGRVRLVVRHVRPPAPETIRPPDADAVPVPTIPYPASASLSDLRCLAADGGWGRPDQPWVRMPTFGRHSPDGGPDRGYTACLCGDHGDERAVLVDMPRRDLALGNGQPAYVFAGACPRCGTLYWGTD